MKKIFYAVQLFIVITFLVSCGGGSGDTTFSGSVVEKVVIINCNNSNNSVGINDCGNSSTPDYFTCVRDGDRIVSTNNNTQLLIIDRSDGTRKVCVQSTNVVNSAHILREL